MEHNNQFVPIFSELVSIIRSNRQEKEKKMKELIIRKLEDGEKIGMFSEVVLLKKEQETIVYDVENVDEPSVCDILSRVFQNHSIVNFEVTCSEEQNFIAGLYRISGFNISGTLSTGEKFEINFNHFSIESEELLNVSNENEYVGNPAYGDRTTEWTTESTVDKDSELYNLLKEQAKICNMDISELDRMLDAIAEHCTGSDVEY